jgi:tryptophan-rich sensory protein
MPLLWILSMLIVLICLGIAGYRIFDKTVSVGRRILFFSILLILVLWPILWITHTENALAIGTLFVGIGILFTIMLMVMMMPKGKDIISSLFLIPLLLWFIGTFILTYKNATSSVTL